MLHLLCLWRDVTDWNTVRHRSHIFSVSVSSVLTSLTTSISQCAFSDFRFAPFWEKEKLPSITNPFLAGNDSYDGFIDCYQKKKCGKVWESMFFHLCLLSLLKPKVCA